MKGFPKGMCPLCGERARGAATRGKTSVMFADAGEMVSRPELAPSAGAGEASFWADPATVEWFNSSRQLHTNLRLFFRICGRCWAVRGWFQSAES